MENEYVLMIIMIALIIGITATEMVKYQLKARQLGLTSVDDELSDKVTQLSLQNQALNERIQVLERIVTESDNTHSNSHLAQQINALK